MSQFKITAVEGLRTQEEPNWADFYSDEKEHKQKVVEQDTTTYTFTENDAVYDDDFEDMDDDVDDENKHEETPRLNLDLTSSSRNTSSERLDDTDSQLSNSGSKPRKKGKAGRKSRTGSSNKPPPLYLYQDQLRDQLRYSRAERPSPLHMDSMSDQEVRRRRGRKLHRRGQMKKYHSLEQAVEQAGRDRLEQKYVELEELMTRPLVDSHRAHVPVQALRQTSKKQRHPAKKPELKGNEPEHRSMRAWTSNSTLNEDETTDRQAYSTIRKMRPINPGPQKQLNVNANQQTASGSKMTSHELQQNSRLASKPPVPRQHKTLEDSSPATHAKTLPSKTTGDGKPQENGFDTHVTDEGDEDDKFGNVSPRSVYLPAEMHLKYTDNPKLQEWLKHKNVEYRQARKAERAKKREERLEKQAELERRAAQREKSSERVKQWMDMKRKEAAKQQKAERRRRKQEAQEQAAQRTQNAESGIRGSRIDRPQSAPSANKKYIPIKRPESAARLENGAYMPPKPPDTKFVYKRPVSGKVRLMKMQNEKNAKSREEEQKKLEELSPEEKEKKMRMSYDAWLIAKRKEDAEKRKEAKRQQELIKSDPEMDRLIPELAVRRIENINNEKKSIDTGVSVIDDDVNKRFGGGSFGKDDEQQSLRDSHDSVPDPSSYSLTAEGSSSTLVELNNRARPAVAKTRMPIPQSAFSPRRPQSAKPSRDSSPKVRAIMDTDHMSQPNPFKFPFSDSYGAPLHARRTQERFSCKSSSSQPKDDRRPEPQGCASAEPTSCPKDDAGGPKANSFPKGVDEAAKPDTTPRSSLVLLQQIEADAVKSEENLKQHTPPSPTRTSASSVEQSLYAGSGEKAQDLSLAEPVQSTVAAENTKDNVGSNKSGDCEQKPKETDNKETSVEKPVENPTSEHSPWEELSEKNSVPKRETPNISVLDDKDTENELSKQLSTATKADTSTEDGQNHQLTGEGTSQEPQSSETEDTPRRSMKRVSFSEDLATVFQTSSPETSSNFDDERGVDENGADPYMSLDAVPEPV